MNNPINALSPINGVSKNYGFIPTSELVSLAEGAGFKLNRQVIQRVNKPERDGFQKHKLVFRNETLFDTTTNSYVELVIVNSHDRSTALHVHLGIFRTVCENGLVTGNSLFSAKIFHTGKDLNSKVNSILNSALSTAPQVVDTINKMHNRFLNNTEALRFASKAAGLLVQESNQERFIDAQELLRRERDEDKQVDLWTIFNVVQEHALRGGYKYIKTERDAVTGQVVQRRGMKARPVKSIERDIKLNKMLFDLALEYT